ncbi:hypothetical protein [Enterococcus faecium]|uniref:hypothetical protein n=1 Tax=Enterococcus faecium TaxID=1352 RepID=UPI000A4A7444|nr:hypothetical protein [Enterococcus faecium]
MVKLFIKEKKRLKLSLEPVELKYNDNMVTLNIYNEKENYVKTGDSKERNYDF